MHISLPCVYESLYFNFRRACLCRAHLQWRRLNFLIRRAVFEEDVAKLGFYLLPPESKYWRRRAACCKPHYAARFLIYAETEFAHAATLTCWIWCFTREGGRKEQMSKVCFMASGLNKLDSIVQKNPCKICYKMLILLCVNIENSDEV